MFISHYNFFYHITEIISNTTLLIIYIYIYKFIFSYICYQTIVSNSLDDSHFHKYFKFKMKKAKLTFLNHL